MNRVEITPAAELFVDKLRLQHGPLMFHQSGGCCDGSSPMCFPVGDFMTSESDVLLGQSQHHVLAEPEQRVDRAVRDDGCHGQPMPVIELGSDHRRHRFDVDLALSRMHPHHGIVAAPAG